MYCFKSIISFYLIIVNSLVITKLYSHNPESAQTNMIETIPLIPNTITNKIPSLNSTISHIDQYDMLIIDSIYRGTHISIGIYISVKSEHIFNLRVSF